MLLVLGDSFAARLASRCTTDDRLQAVGRGGARLGDDHFRQWVIQQAMRQQPQRVALIVGGNDVARREFRQRLFLQQMEELCTGLIAAGVPSVIVLPIMPRDSMRSTDVSRSAYRHRRRLANKIMCQKFCRAPVFCPRLPQSVGFLGRDGVHPSESGWRELVATLRSYM